MIETIKEKALQNEIPIIKDEGLKFLLAAIKENNIKNILELGTAVGYSSINMAKISKDIRIDTVEKNEEMYKQAIKNIEEEGLKDQISVFFMPIEEFKTDKMYDLVFVDAAKAQYGKYLEMFLPNLKENGIMLFDNMVFHQMIYHVDDIKSRNTRSLVRKIIKFREQMIKDERFDIMMFDQIGDGVMILRRRVQR